VHKECLLKEGGVFMKSVGLPHQQGLYDPRNEKDACGVGFIVNVKGESSFNIVKNGLRILKNMEHRGAVGADPKTGDGAGILTQIPDEFFKIYCANDSIDLPDAGEYGIGMIFLPKEPALRLQCEGITERVVAESGHKTLGWRFVPVDSKRIGETARGTEPVIRQVFVKKVKNIDWDTFEKELFLIRKRIENEIEKLLERNKEYFYICSFSSRTIVYKGLLLADQIEKYYLDLNDINFKSSMALVHQRFSTNTFPTWDLAQPFRYLAHNGEINTIKGNRNWMETREGVLTSEVYGEDINDLYPILQKDKSDSASVDNAFEFIKQNGRTSAHTLMMLIPEAWENDQRMSKEKKAFYEYHAAMIESWDGPAAMYFCDGIQVGGTLDRNGLRPAKYVITNDDIVVMASEFGVLKFKPKDILKKGSLRPGEMLMIDTKRKEIFFDEEIKDRVSKKMDYVSFVEKNRLRFADLPDASMSHDILSSEQLLEKQKLFNYSMEDMRLILKPMAETGKEPIGSMGNDTPLAIFSNKSQLMFNYFRQLFAQVTNPPIDSIREGIVMSITNFIGTQEDILHKENLNNKYLLVDSPVINNEEMDKLKSLRNEDFKSSVIPITFKADSGITGFKNALDLICKRALTRVREGYNIIVLSDAKVDSYEAAIPSLLAVSAVHHYLIDNKLRSKISILVETGDARETTHFALLSGYGASAVNPYMAIESIKDMVGNGMIKCTEKSAIESYIRASSKGIAKILSKMGICTIQSYHGAQIFEILGINQETVDKYFGGTPTRIGGIGIDEIAEEILMRHREAYNILRTKNDDLNVGGLYKWRKNGEFHLFNPDTIFGLQQSVRTGDYFKFKKYTANVNDQNQNLTTIRSMFEFKNKKPIPIEEVEPVSEILKRFCSGAMSIGSISKEAHETIAIAMNRIGGKSNSGEGGEDRARLLTINDVDNRNSAIKQVASGRFGVTIDYLASAEELQIKVAQGAKPGEGGHLPGKKVNEYIGKIRHAIPGIDLISPPPHHDIYSIEDLAQLIFDLKNSNPAAKISVKLVSENGVGTVAAGVAKAHADVILISGHDGGTGAAPLSSIRNVGIPWEIGLSETHQVLLLNNLRSRVRIQTDGQLKTGRDVAIACLLGAEEFGFATTCLVAVGCVMLRHCQNNNCEMGVATQDEELRKNFCGKPEYVINFMKFIAREVREYMAELGFRTINEMVGRVDKLEVNKEIDHWKAKTLDLSKILYRPDVPRRITPYCSIAQDHGLEGNMDSKLIQQSQGFFKNKTKVSGTYEIKNLHRTVGTMLSGEIAKTFPNEKLEDDTLNFEFYGSAGQSFGAFAVKGLTLQLEGDANDYVGKGLSGGKIIIRKPREAEYGKSIIAGNTIMYGATSGNVFINGIVGERFAVRNSGASAIVEGVGNHGCEYMTDGFVVILGSVGRNFAAGMSGGTAIVLDVDNSLEDNCNMDLIILEKPTKENMNRVKKMISEHLEYTDSMVAREIMDNWNKYRNKFKRVIPARYKEITEIKTDKVF
jgi:glutamate synthase (NADPH/NADH) large chain